MLFTLRDGAHRLQTGVGLGSLPGDRPSGPNFREADFSGSQHPTPTNLRMARHPPGARTSGGAPWAFTQSVVSGNTTYREQCNEHTSDLGVDVR
jgi:hypothetical protein